MSTQRSNDTRFNTFFNSCALVVFKTHTADRKTCITACCFYLLQLLRNELEVTRVNLSEILPAATIMVVSVTASTTQGCVVMCKQLLHFHQVLLFLAHSILKSSCANKMVEAILKIDLRIEIA